MDGGELQLERATGKTKQRLDRVWVAPSDSPRARSRAKSRLLCSTRVRFRLLQLCVCDLGVGGGFGSVNAKWNKIACQDAAGSDNDDEIHFWDAKWISAVRGASVCAPTAQAQGGCRYTTQRPRRCLADSSPDEPPTSSQRSYTPFVE